MVHIGSFRAFVECDLDEKNIPDSFATLPTLQRQVKDRKKTRKDQKITMMMMMMMMMIPIVIRDHHDHEHFDGYLLVFSGLFPVFYLSFQGRERRE